MRDELAILRKIRRMVPARKGAGVVLGIGDDCAVFHSAGASEDLLFTTDMVIEDVHFRRGFDPAGAVGRRTLARGLSDIAAMGGKPRFCLLSLALAPWAGPRWLDAFLKGFRGLARETGVVLAGGDLAKAEKVMADIVVCGSVPQGQALRRDGASAGDAIYVTGELGASALGLEKGRGPAWQRHLRPVPRLELGRIVRQQLRATSAMDISDGLSLDLHRLCLASGLAAVIEREPPRFRGASLSHALHGGEDYELLFTVRPGQDVPRRRRGVRLTCIGTMLGGKPGAVEFNGKPLEPHGYDHFKKH